MSGELLAVSGEGITLRPAVSEDAETLVGLIHAAFAEYEGMIDPPVSARKETAENIRRKLETAQGSIAEADGIPVGCVLCEPRADVLYLFRLSVLPAYRSRGIGIALMRAVETQAAHNPAFRAVLLGTRVAMPTNRVWYEKQGYHVTEYRTHPGYDTPTIVMLEKPLPR